MADIESTLAELGMTFPSDTQTRTGDKPGTALALPTQAAVFKRALADLIDGAARTQVQAKHLDTARQWMWDRLVYRADGKTPEMVPVAFEGQLAKDGTDVHISARVTFGGQEHEVLPLVVVDVPYVRLEGGRFVSNGTFMCAVFKPAPYWAKGKGGKSELKPGSGPYKVYPFGLVDEAILGTWNRVAADMPTMGWPHIDPIPSKLRSPGVRTLTRLPACYEPVKAGDERSPWTIGNLFGKRLLMAHRSQPIPVTDDEAENGFQTRHVFRYRERESSIELVWLGQEGVVKIDDRIPMEELRDEIDPFGVLGTDVMRFNPANAEREVRRQKQLGRNGQLYRKALELGLVTESDSDAVIDAQLDALGREALIMATRIWESTLEAAKERLSRPVVGIPAIADLLQGRLLKDALVKLSPESDATAVWISEHTGAEFNWASPFHRALRTWLLERAAKHARYRDPEPPKADDKPEASKANGATEHPQVQGHIDVPALNEASADGKDDKPKRAPRSGGRGGKGGSSKKAKGDQPAADNGAAS